jgi:hypothetical protein
MLPDRRTPMHGVHQVDGQPTIVFGTVCTKDRSRWLAAPEIHAILRQVWSGADAWLLGRYVIMPDHVHFFAGWTGVDLSFDAWVRYWKSQVSKALQQPLGYENPFIPCVRREMAVRGAQSCAPRISEFRRGVAVSRPTSCASVGLKQGFSGKAARQEPRPPEPPVGHFHKENVAGCIRIH